MTTKGQVRNFFPALRVFIFGQEVTEDVLSVSVTHNDARAPSTAEIVLANKGTQAQGGAAGATEDVLSNDRYIVTNEDIQAMYAKVTLANVDLPEFQAHVGALADSLKGTLTATAQLNALLNPTSLATATVAATAEADAFITKATESTVDEVNRQIMDRLAREVRDPVKQAILAKKVTERFKIPDPNPKIGGEVLLSTVAQIAGFRGEALRYPFQVGDCIFHSNDAVRIFLRDPRDGKTWFHMFAGFVSDWTDDVDVNNTKTVTLRVEDVTRALRYARFTTSPGIVDITAAATHADLVTQTFMNDDYKDLNLVEMMYAMIFGFISPALAADAGVNVNNLSGKTPVRLVSVHGENELQMPRDGVGFFDADKSITFVFGEDAQAALASVSNVADVADRAVAINNLGIYQATVDHQVRVTDLESMARGPAISREGLGVVDPVTGAPTIESVITAVGENPHIYPVDGGRLIMLVPSSVGIGVPADILIFGFKGPELKSTFSTRLQKIYDILERIEFTFYASPKGDLLCEMPLNDFHPDDFGTEEITFNDLSKALDASRAETILDPKATVGPYAPYFKVSRNDTISWSRSFTDESVRTMATCSWHPLRKAINGVQDAIDTTGTKPARRILTSLVPQFGVRHETCGPTVLTIDAKSAEIYAQMTLNRINSEARTASMDVIPQMRMMPNRPVLFTERNFIATVREASQQLTWGEGGDMSMNLNVNYVRGWDGQIDANGRPEYAYLGGFASNYQNYALLFRKDKPESSSIETDDAPPKLRDDDTGVA